MRHAKSSWAEGGLSDFDRPLNDRGRRDAPRMAIWLREKRWLPDFVLCSAARRTQETWQLMQAVWDHPIEFELRRDLYHASASHFWNSGIDSLSDHRRVLVIGHNPGMQQLVAKFQMQLDHFPTAAVAAFQELDPQPYATATGQIPRQVNSHYSDWKLIEWMAPKLLPSDGT
jgi:phosphohistidine phosphatase